MDSKEILNIKDLRLGNIPCTYVRPNYHTNKGTIIYYHGWSSKRKNGLFIGKILAFHGHSVILPDAIHHGERNALENYNVESMKKFFWDTIFCTVDEYKSLISIATEKLNIDKSNVGVIGSSMGGFIASGVFAENKEIKCLISLNGACAWEKAENIFKDIDRDGKGAASSEQREKIIKNDPLTKKYDLFPRPILMLHGDSDTSVDIEIQRYFFSEIKDLYKDKIERLKLIEVERLNHYKTVEMIEESLTWFDKYLDAGEKV